MAGCVAQSSSPSSSPVLGPASTHATPGREQRPWSPGRPPGRPRPGRHRRRPPAAGPLPPPPAEPAAGTRPAAGLQPGGVRPARAVRLRSPAAAVASRRAPSISPGTTSARAGAGRVICSWSPSRLVRSSTFAGAGACSIVRTSAGRPPAGRPAASRLSRSRPRDRGHVLSRLPQLTQGPPGVVDRAGVVRPLALRPGQRLIRRRPASAASARSRWTRSSAVLKISRDSIAFSDVVDLGKLLGQLLSLPLEPPGLRLQAGQLQSPLFRGRFGLHHGLGGAHGVPGHSAQRLRGVPLVDGRGTWPPAGPSFPAVPGPSRVSVRPSSCSPARASASSCSGGSDSSRICGSRPSSIRLPTSGARRVCSNCSSPSKRSRPASPPSPNTSVRIAFLVRVGGIGDALGADQLGQRVPGQRLPRPRHELQARRRPAGEW